MFKIIPFFFVFYVIDGKPSAQSHALFPMYVQLQKLLQPFQNMLIALKVEC